MSISTYSKQLTQNLRSDTKNFVHFYMQEQQSILDELSRNPDLKTEFKCRNYDTYHDWVKFSIIFSDITSLNLGLGKGGSIVLPNELKNGLSLTFPFDIPEEMKSKIKKGEVSPGYTTPSNEELSSIVDTLEPLIDAGKILIRPERIILYPETDRHEGEGRSWKIFSIDPNSPAQNWLVIEESLEQKLLPIQAGKVNPEYEDQLFDISLPYLDGIDFKNLSKIVHDEQDHLNSLRAAIKKSIAESKNNINSVSDISNDIIKPEISKINKRFKAISQIHSLRISGACISTATLSLVALNTNGWVAAIASFLGAGGLGLIANEYSEYIKSKNDVTDNPYYLFWRLKNSKKSKISK